ncbi:MAG TPA: glycosyltransferase, partial [Anaerolineae bacterium]|nr:glycosyltransferase [Anaerolineae bacterium]
PLGEPILRRGVTHWFFHRQTQFYKFSLPLTRWLAQHTREYDLLHIHALFSYATLPAARFATRAGVPYIIRPLGTLNRYGLIHHHQRLKQISYRWIERWILEQAAVIQFTSEQERSEAAELGITTRKVVLPLGVELSTAAAAPASTEWLAERAPFLVGRTNLLFLGRLDAKKGLDLLLDALAQLKREGLDVGLMIAGEGEARYAQMLKQQTRALDLESDIWWAGFVQDAEKQKLLRAAQIFVLPSYSENFGIAVVEAMAAGLPVVISDQIGVSEWVAQAHAGVITSCKRGALTAALSRLIENPFERATLAANGMRLACETLSLQATTRALVDLYQEILAERRDAAKNEWNG